MTTGSISDASFSRKAGPGTRSTRTRISLTGFPELSLTMLEIVEVGTRLSSGVHYRGQRPNVSIEAAYPEHFKFVRHDRQNLGRTMPGEDINNLRKKLSHIEHVLGAAGINARDFKVVFNGRKIPALDSLYDTITRDWFESVELNLRPLGEVPFEIWIFHPRVILSVRYIYTDGFLQSLQFLAYPSTVKRVKKNVN